MVSFLLSHSWKKFTRSGSFSKDTTTLVITIIVGLIMFAYALALGLTLDIILIRGLQVPDAIGFLNSLLLYFFGFEFIMRYMMQNLPVLDVQPYLHLPVKKSGLVHYMLLRSAVHLMNVLPVIIFLPFALKVIANEYSTAQALAWVATIWVSSMVLHYVVVLFKKVLADSVKGIAAVLVVIVFFAAADYFQWFQLSVISESVFDTVLYNPLLATIPLVLLVAIYLVDYKFFREAMYPEEIRLQKSNSALSTGEISVLKNFGIIGELINVELKLILRNKRPKNILFLSAFFLLYGLIFYSNDKYVEGFSPVLLFVGIFVTGIFMIYYGQLLFSWQAGHYDFALTRPISLRQYVESKYWLLSAATIICFILSTPYLYFGWNILLIHLATTLFNVGVNVFVILNIAMWDPKRIDLKKSATFNHEGVGLAQWIMSIPIVLGPIAVFLPFSIAGKPEVGIIAVGVIGIIGIVFRARLIDWTTKRLLSKKYKMAAGFRKD